MAQDEHSPTTQFSWRSAIVVAVMVLIGTFVLALVVQAVLKVREAAARTQTNNNLKQLTLACLSCNDAYKRLPPAFGTFGNADFPVSVHVLLNPFCMSSPFYRDFLNAHGKGAVRHEIIAPFLSPLDNSVTSPAGVSNFPANLRVFSDKGLNTRFDADMPPLGHVEPSSASIPDSFPDGTSNTIAFATKYAVCGDGGSRYVEAPDSKFAAFFGQNAAQIPAHPSDLTATFQLAPAPPECQPAPLMAQSFSRNAISVSLFDGSVRNVSAEVSARTWNLAVQPNDEKALGQDWNQ